MFIVAVFLVSGRQREVSRRETWQLIQGLHMQEKELQHRQASTMRLLSSFCDCVFTMGSDLCLAQPSKSLASMLLHYQTIPEGTSLCKLLKHAHDEERLREFLHQSSSEDHEDRQSLPSSLVLDLCDSMGRNVCTRVYLASIRAATATQFMVGVVEASERDHPESTASTSSATAALGQVEHHSVSELDQSSTCSRRRHSSEAGDELLSIGVYEGSLCSFDIVAEDRPKAEPLCASIRLSADLEIVRCNAAFAAAVGGDSAGPFGAHLGEAEPVYHWLRQLQADLANGSLEPPTLCEFGIVDVMKKGGSVVEPMWMAVALPVDAEGSLKDSVLRGTYIVNARLTEPTSKRALNALARRRTVGDAGRLHNIVPALPGSI